MKRYVAKRHSNKCLPIAENRFFQLLVIGYVSILALVFAGCGGGSSSSSSSQNPVPSITSLSPSASPAGSRALTLTVTGTKFISGSAVRWNGSTRPTTYVSSTSLHATITPDDLATSGTATVTVYNPSPGGGTSDGLSFTISSVSPLAFLTKQLPDAAHDKEYSYKLMASGGIAPYTYIVSSGNIPGGLSVSSDGIISGIPASVSTDTAFGFEVQVSDYSYQPLTAGQSFNILARAGSLGRNDTCSAATPVSNGMIRASISPYGDVDVYSFEGTAGSRVTIEIYAQRLALYGDSTSTDVFLDSFLEILNSSCVQLTYNDDISLGSSLDSLISNYQLPYTGTYYIRVSDLRADGRPDFIYELHLSGAN